MTVRATQGGNGSRLAALGLALVLALAVPAARPRFSGASSGEQFVVPVPSGWKLGFSVSRPGLEMREYVPRGQSVETWSEMITSQVFPDLGNIPLEGYLEKIAVAARPLCEGLRVTPVTAGAVNGYPAASMTQFCPRYARTGKGEITLFKVIQGGGGLYVAQRAWRGTPFIGNGIPVPEDTYADWTRFLDRVSLCDAGDPAHPCPALRQ